MALTQLESYMVGPTASTPKITSLAYAGVTTAANSIGGETLTITGSGFVAGATVYVDTTSCATTFVNSTTLTFIGPAKSPTSYHLYVYNTDGSFALKPGGITVTGYTVTAVEYLVVGGGGGGSTTAGGGGGAGGYRTATDFAVASGVPLTVTVGGGGAGATTDGGNGVNGTASVFSTITSAGGGKGHHVSVGGSGASGGGGGYGSSFAGGTATPAGQGYDGGVGGSVAAPHYPCAGGGGAGGVGGSVVATAGGNGGPGLSSSITGALTYYAGGGAGSGSSGAVGGIGGGGNGGTINTGRESGTVNTGGGGGGGGAAADGKGLGGSGIVIIRYADGYVAATNTTNLAAGYPVVSGGYRIYKWITSGTITF